MIKIEGSRIFVEGNLLDLVSEVGMMIHELDKKNIVSYDTLLALVEFNKTMGMDNHDEAGVKVMSCLVKQAEKYRTSDIVKLNPSKELFDRIMKSILGEG